METERTKRREGERARRGREGLGVQSREARRKHMADERSPLSG